MSTTTKRSEPAALTVHEAAELYRVSEDVIRKAIHATEPPCLDAKKVGGRIRIRASALEAWFDSLPDA